MIKAIAIDDEPLALKLVVGYIRKTPFLELLGSFDNPLTAMEFMAQNKVDLIFLDIQMPDLTGTQFARTLTNGPKIIFTTAYEKYALEGFRLDAVDYLLKPFGYEDFLVAALKAKKLIGLEEKETTSIEANSEFLFLKSKV
jgi:two-component SAPR family response regulator